MKAINFITHVPAAKHRQLATWHTITMAFSCIIVGIIITTQIKQLITWYTLKKEVAGLHGTTQALQKYTQQKEIVVAQEKAILEKIATIEQFKNSIEKTIQRLTALQATIGTQGVVESMAWNVDTQHVNFYCNNAHNAVALSQSIAKIPECKALHITAMQPHNGQNKILVKLSGKTSTSKKSIS